MKWLRQLFCKHDFVFLRNSYGDGIHAFSSKRSVWACIHCPKREYRDELQKVSDET